MADYKQIRVRRDTLANWTGVVPANGEPIGIIGDDGRVTTYKIGDGSTTADQLPALSKGDTGARGIQGLPGTNGVATDDAVATNLGSAGSKTNTAALKLIPSHPFTVMMLGDSIIAGAGTTTGNDVVTRTGYWLNQYTGHAVTMVNGGVSGDTTGQMLNRLPQLLTDAAPTVVVVSTTVNDLRTDMFGTTTDTEANLRRIIGILRTAGVMPVLLTNTPFTTGSFSGSYDQGSVGARAAQVAMVRGLATSLGVRIADVDTAWGSIPDFPSLYTADGLHPNDAGADGWARVVAAAIGGRPSISGLGAGSADSFDRADTRSGLGITPTGGHAWRYDATDGSWAIIGSQAGVRLSRGGSHVAFINDGLSNHTLSVTIAAFQNGSTGIVFRRSAIDSYWLAWIDGSGKWQLWKNVAGTFAAASSGPTAAVGDVVAINAVGSNISVRINGTAQMTASDTFNNTATEKGLWSPNSPTSRFDSFSSVPAS